MSAKEKHKFPRGPAAVILATTVAAGCAAYFFFGLDIEYFAASLDRTSKHSADFYLRGEQLRTQQKYSAAARMFQLSGDRAATPQDKARAYLELSKLQQAQGKQKESKYFARKSLVALARACSPKGQDSKDDVSDDALISQLVLSSIELLRNNGDFVIFGTRLPNESNSETRVALQTIYTYFQNLDEYSHTTWALKRYEKDALKGLSARDTKVVATVLAEYSLACFKARKFDEGFACTEKLVKNMDYFDRPDLSQLQACIELSQYLLKDGLSEEGLSKTAARKTANKLLNRVSHILGSHDWFLLQQVEPETAVAQQQQFARVCLLANNEPEAKLQFETTMSLARKVSLSSRNIFALTRLYCAFASQMRARSNFDEASLILERASAFLNETASFAPSGAGVDRVATIDLCRGLLEINRADIEAALNHLADSELSYRNAIARVSKTTNSLSSWITDPKNSPSLTKSLQSSLDMADEVLIEAYGKLHTNLAAQKRSSDDIAMLRLAASAASENARKNVSREVYLMLIDALARGHRFEDLDSLLAEVRAGTPNGAGELNEAARIRLLTTGATIYANLGERSRAGQWTSALRSLQQREGRDKTLGAL